MLSREFDPTPTAFCLGGRGRTTNTQENGKQASKKGVREGEGERERERERKKKKKKEHGSPPVKGKGKGHLGSKGTEPMQK